MDSLSRTLLHVRPHNLDSSAQSEARFETTHWSLVLEAGRHDGRQSRDALAALCSAYWEPVYAFLRRKGRNPEDARDLTQAFFARLLEKDVVGAADPRRGRFRSFLLKCVQHFVSHQDEQADAMKRGGGQVIIPLDVGGAESRYCIEPFHELTPEHIFERRWAMALLARVLDRLRHATVRGKDAREFDRLKVFLGGALPNDSHAAAANDLDMTEAAVKVAVHRMRKAYRDLLREEISRTVESPAEVDDEIRSLFTAIAG